MNPTIASTSRLCCRQESQNVGNPERLGSAIAGGALLLCALRPKFLPGPVWALAGGAIAAGLLARAATGHCAVYDRMGVNTVGHQDSPDPPPVYEATRPLGEAAPLAMAAPPINPPFDPIIDAVIDAPNDSIDEASQESFPASDPPSSIVTSAG